MFIDPILMNSSLRRSEMLFRSRFAPLERRNILGLVTYKRFAPLERGADRASQAVSEGPS